MFKDLFGMADQVAAVTGAASGLGLAMAEVLAGAGATVVLLIPIATELAKGLHLPPMAFIFAILFAASQSFLTPIGYQTNLMVYGPGRYRFLDMTRYGAPLTIGLALVVPFLICRHFGL